MRNLLCLFGVLIVNVWSTKAETYNTTIVQGVVIGSRPDVRLNYYEFHGIPYADSTSGEHRFKAPRPALAFVDGIFNADRKHIKCIHSLGAGYEGTEDCLVANVFTPTVDNTARLPVMVWVEGNEFETNHKHDFTFKNILKENVLVVTLNHRESIFGYLCLGTEDAPGNAGLKDIIAGLQWIQDNIEQFGGDPNSVTLFGHGSGAAAVDLVTLSPLSKNLVHKAISQSGSALAPWAVTRDNLKYAVTVAESLGHQISNIELLPSIFAKTSTAALMAVINELELTNNAIAFSPCIENPDLEDVQPFLVKTPFQIMDAGDFEPIPFITGFVDQEGTIKAREAFEDQWLEKMQTSFLDFIPPDLEFTSQTQKDMVADDIRNFYFGDREISIEDYISYHGDTMILVSALREAQLRSKASESPVFVYQFSYKGPLGEPFVGPVEVDGTAHSEDLAYLFYDPLQTTTTSRSIDLAVGDILIERCTSFAKTGQPTSTTSHIDWKPFSATNSNFIRILHGDEINEVETTLEVELVNPHPATLNFWSEIYENHFKDAASDWEFLNNRDDEIVDSGDSNTGGDGSSGEDNGSDGNEPDGDATGGGGTDVDVIDGTDTGSSAPAGIGCSFLIVSLFVALTNCLDLQILT